MSQTTFRDMRKNPTRSCKYILIQKDEETFDMKTLDMSQQYEIIYKSKFFFNSPYFQTKKSFASLSNSLLLLSASCLD